MLGKLIKYDLKALAKILAPLWGVLLVMGIIFGISIRSNLEGIGNTMIVFTKTSGSVRTTRLPAEAAIF